MVQRREYFVQLFNSYRTILIAPEIILGALTAIFLTSVIWNAWTGDDSYITFRTVDNFINGYGLRWNVDERVQSFTHPLWLFCLIFFSLFSSDIWITVITLSVCLSLVTFLLLVLNSRLALSFRVSIALILIFSKAFVEYSTSGLENPLTHLLLTVFFLIALDSQRRSSNLRVISLLVALLATNRIDSLLIPLPLFIYCVYLEFQSRSFVSILCDIFIGLLPIFCWELFSLGCYGFLAPNTAYAKLGAEQNREFLLVHGILYLGESIARNPVTLFGIFTGVAWVVAARSRTHLLAAVGPALYLLYVINIGGDFMSGRFLTAPLLSALIIGATAAPQISPPLFKRTCATTVLAGFYTICFSHALVAALSPETTDIKGTPLFGINDEAAYYWETNSLRQRLYGVSPADHEWAREGASLRRGGAGSTVLHGNIGLLGYYAGPRVTIIDYHALSDPLLARLPARSRRNMIGHFERDLPRGYLESTVMQTNVINDPNLGRYYERLDLITRGDLFSLNRLREIFRFNAGYYNNLRELYTIAYSISRLEKHATGRYREQYPCVSTYAWGDQNDKPLLPECGSFQGAKQEELVQMVS